MLIIKVHGHAPGEAGAGDAEVLKTGLDEVVHHLVHAGGGLEEIRILQQMLYPLGVLTQAEEIGFLLRIHDLAAAVGTLAVLELALRPERLAGLTVLALIGAFINVTLVIHLAEDLLDGLHMIVVRSADKAVVTDVHQLPEVEDALFTLDNVVHEFLGRHAGGLGLVLDLLTVLVRSREEHDIVAREPLIARHGIRRHGAVAVADVELVRGIVDGGGDIECLFLHGMLSFFAPRPNGRRANFSTLYYNAAEAFLQSLI